MLVIYDEATGMVNQCIIQAEVTLLELAARYREMGIPHVLYDGEAMDIMACYVRDGQVVAKPVVRVAGEHRPVKADGRDALEFQVEPVEANVTVMIGEHIIHSETIADGRLEFVTDHAGTYTVQVGAAFPYLGTQFTVEAA